MYVRMLHIYVPNQHFYTRISYMLNEKRWYFTNSTFLKKTKKKVLSVKWYLLSPNTVLL